MVPVVCAGRLPCRPIPGVLVVLLFLTSLSGVATGQDTTDADPATVSSGSRTDLLAPGPGPSSISETDSGPGATAAPVDCALWVSSCPGEDPIAWLDWAETAPLQQIVEAATYAHRVADPPDRPDTWAQYPGLPPEEQKALWLGWWAQPPQFSGGDPGVDPQPAGEGPWFQRLSQQQTSVVAPGGGEEDEEDWKINSTFGLRPLWGLVEHGQIQDAHPANDEGAWVLVSWRSVILAEDPLEGPDWLLGFEDTIRESRVSAPGPDGTRFLGLAHGWSGHSIRISGGMIMMGIPEPTELSVVDLETAEVVFEGFHRSEERDERAVRWSFTDVSGDGSDDLLVLTVEGELVAVDLRAGQEIYRVDLPTPDVILPVPVSQGYQGRFPVFGDATGDGVQDLYMLNYVHRTFPEVRTSSAVAMLIRGQDGQTAWERTVDVEVENHRFVQGIVTGDLTGDGRDDLVFSETRPAPPTSTGFYHTYVVGVDAESGGLLFQDDHSIDCPVEEICPPDYLPLAVLDLDGDGRGSLVGLEVEPFSLSHAVQGIVVRELPAEPIPRTQLVAREPTEDLRYHFSALAGKMNEYGSPGAPGGVYLTPEQNRLRTGTQTSYRVDAEGIHVLPHEEQLLLVAAHPESGEAFGWILRDDHWAPLDPDLRRDDEGFRLIVSARPIWDQDENGDGVPDLLLRASAGYRWIDGRNGTFMRTIERPPQTYHRQIYPHGDGLFVLETQLTSDGSDYRFGPIDGEPLWTLSRDSLDADVLMALADFTGDGHLELLTYTFPRYHSEFEDALFPDSGTVEPERTPAKWAVRTPGSASPLWEHETESSRTATGIDDTTSPARIFLSYTLSEKDQVVVSLHQVGEDPLWERTFEEDVDFYASSDSLFLMRETTEDDEVHLAVHSMDDGSPVHTVKFTAEERFNWARLGELGGAPRLVTSHSSVEPGAAEPAPDAEVPKAQEHVRVLDRRGNVLGSIVSVNDPGEVIYDEDDSRWWISPPWRGEGYRTSWFAGFLEDGDDGDPKILLGEDDRLVVRDLAGSRMLAASGRGSSLSILSDLNGDGREELGLMNSQRGTFQFHVLDPDHEEEDDTETEKRVDLRSSGNETRDLDEFFEDRGSTPLPVIAPLLALLLAAVWMRGRRRI